MHGEQLNEEERFLRDYVLNAMWKGAGAGVAEDKKARVAATSTRRKAARRREKAAMLWTRRMRKMTAPMPLSAATISDSRRKEQRR